VRVLFVKQDHASPAGPVAEAFADLGYDVAELLVVPEERFHDPGVTVSFPDPAGYDAIVPMGAPWSVYDDTTIGSWIGDELAFLRQALAAGVPILGICFGGQALAAALGGSVEPAPQPEIGWQLVATDRPGLVEPGPWFQWHTDRWRLPAGVTDFARTAVAGQAFTAGQALGLQFHPELTPAMLDGWLRNGGAALLATYGIDADVLTAQTASLAPGAASRARTLVQRFVRQVSLPGRGWVRTQGPAGWQGTECG
jgi:GMP synthase-like glutamine amidotransferase